MSHADCLSAQSQAEFSSNATTYNSDDSVDRDDPAVVAMRQRRALAAELGLRSHELELFFHHGVAVDQIPKHREGRRLMLAHMMKHGTRPPRWVVVSGMYPDVWVDAAERRKRVRIVYKTAVAIIRLELKRHEVDEFKSERSVFWDPVADICFKMEISRSRLSNFCKELTGNSLTQVIDSIRAEGMKEKMRGAIRAFVAGFRAEGDGEEETQGANAGTSSGEEDAAERRGTLWRIWEALKASRKWPEFSRETWAQGLGFASYRRLYRACQVVYGMTPHQLEMALIAECLEEKEEAGGKGGSTGPEFVAISLEEAERMVGEIKLEEWCQGMPGGNG